MKKSIVMGLVFTVLISSLIVVNVSAENNPSMRSDNNISIRGLTAHSVIRINNDTDFANMAAADGWQGNGSVENPYIIANLSIDAHGAGNAIFIGNTTVHFIVENCHLYNASHHSWPYFGGAGIELYHLSNATIKDNIATNNSNDGILLDTSSNVTVFNNTVFNNTGYGISLGYSNNNTISNNTISGSEWDGLNLYRSCNNFILSNEITNSEESGIYLNYASKNNVISNTLLWNEFGIYIDSDSNNNTIINNKIIKNYNYGAYASYGTSYNVIYNNVFFYNNGAGDKYNTSHIQAFDDTNKNYWNNTTTGNYWQEWAMNNNSNDEKEPYGIVDWPYILDTFDTPSDKDNYPLKNLTISVKVSPTAPLNLKATNGTEFVNLTWVKPYGNGTSPIISYNIYRNGKLIATVPATQLWYNDTKNISAGFTYTYYVTAVNAAGVSPASNEVQATPGGAVPEITPMILILVLLSLLVMVRLRR